MMKLKSKHILMIALMVVLILGIVLGNYFYQRHVKNRDREAELQMIREEMAEKIQYSGYMFFDNNFFGRPNIHNRIGVIGSISSMFLSGELEISEVVFVNSAEEAIGFDDNVFVAWPTEWSEMLLDLINKWINPEERALMQHPDSVIDVLDLGLTYPVAKEVMVEDWRAIIEIKERLDYEPGEPNLTNSDRLWRIVDREFSINRD